MQSRAAWRRLAAVLAAAAVSVSAVTVAASGAVAQYRKAPAPPSVSDFHATPAQLKYHGGRVRLTGHTTGAATCKFTSGSAIKGLPVTLPCSGGHPAISVTVPPDHGNGVHSISFQLTALGANKAFSEEGLYVHVLPRAASITSLKASVTKLPSTGGKVTLTGTMVRALLCIITVSPKLAGTPASIPCASGKVSKTLRLPPADGGATESYDFALTAAGLGGSAPTFQTTVFVTGKAPSVSSFTVSPVTLPASGGTVTLSIRVANASECGFGYSEVGGPDPIGHALGTIECTTGTFTYKVHFAANPSSSADTVNFDALVTSQGGQITPPQQPMVVEAAGS
jgi:hypothetical protein